MTLIRLQEVLGHRIEVTLRDDMTTEGRLIDADALVNTVMHTNIPADTKEFIEDLIGIAPTVIEAEEG